jgi:diguanylate cyclase (GGDEF)-like protein/PAS domain S-box-containing protein
MGATAGGSEPASARAVAVLERAAEAGAVAATLAEAAVGVLSDVCGLVGWPVGHLLVTTSPGVLTPTAVWYVADPERYRVLRQVAQAMPVAAGVGLLGRVLASGEPATGTDVGEAAAAAGLGATAAIPVRCGVEVVAVLHLLGPTPLDEATAGASDSLLATVTAAAGELGRVVDRRRAAAAERDRALLLETANDAFVRLDGDGRVVEWNAQAEVTFGWASTEALGRSLTEMVVPLRYRAVLDEAFKRALAEDGGPAVSRRELSVLHRSGAEFPVEITLWGSNDHYRRVVDGFLRDVSERKKFEVQLARQALHDRLTALPNRVLMRDRLENALARTLRHRSTVALLVLDVDRFKVVNDSLGHEGGDKLLVAVAERLTKLLRPGDTLARMGGDEFAMLCEEVTGRDEASTMAGRMVAAMEAPFRVGATDIAVTVSVGVALATGAAMVADLLLRDADVAMYRAKQRGRGRYEVFDEAMRSQAVDRLSVENDLRRAIRQGQLRLVYQPIVRLDTGQVVGFEALVRWQHPERGLLAPADFIPPAEETGLIVPLGQCVLGEACLQAAAWQRRRGTGPPLRMSVNVSAKELQHPGWAADVAGTLADTGLEPSYLVLELTESVLMEDAEATSIRLEELRRLGVRIAIDDFGTGYSSLGYLRRLPVDVLKIDKSFIDGVALGPHESALARAVVKLARTLGLDAVAEGISDRRQLAELRRLRCPYGQGYYFSRPQTVEVIEELLEIGVLPAPGKGDPDDPDHPDDPGDPVLPGDGDDDEVAV